MAPMGGDLGKAAVDFVADGLAPLLPHPGPLRWAVAYVDDAYGRAVESGATAEVAATGQVLAGSFAYPSSGADFTALAGRIAAARADALYVSAYLDDGMALRRALVAQKVPLVVNLGTSSSYCMPAFGQSLGTAAVGVFASDKPDAAAVRPDALSPQGRATLAWAAARYQARYHQPMSSHALSGFSNALALFAHVLPAASGATTDAVAAAAQAVKLPIGSLANGGGLDIAPPGAADAGNNRNAAGVIWEWVAPGREEVVWPPPFATHPVVWMPIDR
jgi:ABC-type branched-subunit amino acid transport system substrate-binding protein